jgi:hypothetical protein
MQVGVAQMLIAFWVLLAGFFITVLTASGAGPFLLAAVASGFILYLGYRTLVPLPPQDSGTDQSSRMP